MKTFNLMTKLGRVLLTAVVALPLAVSCMDDINDLKDKVTNLENRLNELELRLNQELAALEDLINGKITIAKVNPKHKISINNFFIVFLLFYSSKGTRGNSLSS